MSEFRLSREANADLDEIADYYERRDPLAAPRIFDAPFETMEFLADNPGAGDRRDDLRKGMRIFPGQKAARSYVIFFLRTTNGIEIAAVVHGSRDWEAMFPREPS